MAGVASIRCACTRACVVCTRAKIFTHFIVSKTAKTSMWKKAWTSDAKHFRYCCALRRCPSMLHTLIRVCIVDDRAQCGKHFDPIYVELDPKANRGPNILGGRVEKARPKQTHGDIRPTHNPSSRCSVKRSSKRRRLGRDGYRYTHSVSIGLLLLPSAHLEKWPVQDDDGIIWARKGRPYVDIDVLGICFSRPCRIADHTSMDAA